MQPPGSDETWVLRDLAKLDGVRQRTELLEALVLDLPDAFAGHIERPSDLVEGARMLSVQSVPQLEHLTLPAVERPEDLPQRFLAERDLGLLVGQRQVLVRDEVAELGLVLVANRLLEGDGRLGATADLLHLVAGEIEIAADLHRRRLPPELGAELALRAHDLVQLLDHVHGHPDRSGLVGQRARHRLTDPPGRVRRELEAFAVVELLRSADESDRPLLDQIEEGQTLVPVLLGDRDDETEIGLDHLLLRTMVATLDPLRELDLLHAGHDLDLKLLERVVKVVDLGRLQVELVERDRDFVRAQLAVLPPRLEERLGVLRLHEVDDGLRCNGYLYYAHSVPPSWSGAARAAAANSRSAETGRRACWKAAPRRRWLWAAVDGRSKLGTNGGRPGGVSPKRRSWARTAEGESGCARSASRQAATASSFCPESASAIPSSKRTKALPG